MLSRFLASFHLTNQLWLLFSSAANKYQSNLNEIDKFEHKSSIDELNKGYSWPTGHIGNNLGEFLPKKMLF